jgi:hypothetical protein
LRTSGSIDGLSLPVTAGSYRPLPVQQEPVRPEQVLLALPEQVQPVP